MKLSIVLLVLSVAALSSCSTAYKTGQTPDDLYFSPGKPQDEYVQVDREDTREYRNDDYYDDRYLRMKVSNRYRWNDLNDWYGYERYNSGYNYLYGNYNNPYNSWNYYYNPYCHGTVYVTSGNVAYSTPRTFNLATYNTTRIKANNSVGMRYNNSNVRYNNSYTTPRNSSSTRNQNSGNALRDIFRGTNNSNTNSNTGTKPSSTSSSSSSSSGSSSGSRAPVRRF